MMGSIMLKLNYNTYNIPEHVKASIELIKMFKEIDCFIKTKKFSGASPLSQPNYQW